jgi:hypothetical protein
MNAHTPILATAAEQELRKTPSAVLVAHLRAVWSEIDRRGSGSLVDVDDDTFCACADAIDRFCAEAEDVLEAYEPERRFVGTYAEWLA